MAFIDYLIKKIKTIFFDCFLGDDGELCRCGDYPDWLWWLDSLFAEKKPSGYRPKRPDFESLMDKSSD